MNTGLGRANSQYSSHARLLHAPFLLISYRILHAQIEALALLHQRPAIRACLDVLGHRIHLIIGKAIQEKVFQHLLGKVTLRLNSLFWLFTRSSQSMPFQLQIDDQSSPVAELIVSH